MTRSLPRESKREELVDDLLTQYTVIGGIEIACRRCGQDVSLANLHPHHAGGFICRRCLVEMPTKEFRRLCGDARAVDEEWRNRHG